MDFHQVVRENPWIDEAIAELNDGVIAGLTVETSQWADEAYDEDEFVDLMKAAFREGLACHVYAIESGGRRSRGDI